MFQPDFWLGVTLYQLYSAEGRSETLAGVSAIQLLQSSDRQEAPRKQPPPKMLATASEEHESMPGCEIQTIYKSRFEDTESELQC